MKETYLIGIDVGGTTVKMAVFTIEGQMVDKWSIPTNKAEAGNHIVQDIAVSADEHLKKAGIDKKDCIAAGIGVPGFIDMEHGIIDLAVNVGWKKYPIADKLSEALGVPAVVDNDANLAAAGEYWQGAGSGADDVIFLTLGTGVGGGIIINGEIIHGTKGMAGEIGHVTVIAEGGAPCNCGKTGCLETVSSATGMVRLAKDAAGKNPDSALTEYLNQGKELTTKELFEFAAAGDATAQASIHESLHYLGLAAANIGNVLNPEKFIIGGGVSAAGDSLLQALRSHFDTYALERVRDSVEFSTASLGNDAGVIGAAWLAKKTFSGR
ncbi:glucokinase [Sinobaca qinghaiensis]|uniref:Glucokinase n=1 Tax=Sinobaca qinghaiensis TaxID=342944 RepID=A0A419V389_9BACL|nr:ROK family glucokinase [Sinobaca qinghaiensis]RKD72993.1 glucokinase [Sinobaca qinghaiensis]